MYNSEDYHSDYEVEVHIREYLEPLLNSYRVDLVLAGHYHSYERTCKVFEEVCYDDMADNNGEGVGLGEVVVTLYTCACNSMHICYHHLFYCLLITIPRLVYPIIVHVCPYLLTHTYIHAGIVHITIGSAGASLDSAEWMDKNWRVFGDYEFGGYY